MSHYVLVHGAWEESRSWEYITPILQQNGHQVTEVDLPGHGANMRPISEMNMANYIQTVVDIIDAIGYPVVLVAHSMSGAVVSQVAEQIPDMLERLIYVAAFLLENGDSVLQAMQSDDGEFLPNIVFSEDQSYATLPEQTLRSAGFHDVNEEVIQHFLPMIVEKQSTEPFMAQVSVSAKNFGTVPKSYIRTSIDRVTTPKLQDRMIANWPVDAVYELEAGHFPAFSVPGELAELMLHAIDNSRQLQAGNG
jgi:pimeloyl-ACP methyl ester carboxylesterase